MAGGQQWEVVVGGGKAKKNKSKGSKSSLKGKNKDSPAFVLAGPIQESQTIYTPFLEKDKKEPPKPKSNGIETGKTVEKNVQKKKKGDKKGTAAPKISLDEVITSVTEEDLKNHLATLEVLCPDSPLLWLKDLASYLNVKLDIPVEDLTFASKPLGYPSVLLKKKIIKIIVGIFNRCTPQMLQIFYEFCLQNLVQDILKGLHTMGYRIMLQCLAHEMPSVALENLPKCMELCNSHQNRQNICLSILWAAGQAGNNNLEAGFRVWVDLMFPLIGTKNCTAYVVAYLEKLVSGDDVAKCNKSLLDVRDLFPILDFIYSKELVKSIQKRLINIYPILKTLSYGPEPETALRHYFPSYLRRLEPQYPQPLKEEILNSLMYCLEKDDRCYSIWRQLYVKHFVQSKLLISHINDHWESVPSKFPKRCLRDTLSVFQVTNEELLSNGKKSLQDVEECILINKELLVKINAGSFPWLRLILMLILVSSSILTYDILIHGSFTQSITGKLMKDYGLLAICTQAGEKLSYFYGRINKLTQQYVPMVASWFRNTFLPLLELTMKKLSFTLVLLWDSTFELRVWCSETIPPLLATIEKEFIVYKAAFQSMVSAGAVVLSQQTLAGLTFLTSSVDSTATWIQSNPQIMDALGMAKQISVSLVENVQQNAAYLFQLAKEYVPLPT